MTNRLTFDELLSRYESLPNDFILSIYNYDVYIIKQFANENRIMETVNVPAKIANGWIVNNKVVGWKNGWERITRKQEMEIIEHIIFKRRILNLPE